MMNLSSEQTFAKYFFNITNSKITLVQVSTIFVIISSILSCLLVRFLSHKIFIDHKFSVSPKDLTVDNHKNIGILKSFKYIAKSKYLWLMVVCSAAFGCSINLVEAVWKAKIKELYPTVNSYAEFNGLYILWTGVTIIVMTIIGNNIMRNHNWFIAAIISPIIIMVTGIMFFVLVVFDTQILSLFDHIIIISPLVIAVSVGAIQNILAKGTKYSIWDSSMQMLYIPLDKELRTKGKAAVDVVSSKFGKSSSGLLQSVIFTVIPTATFTSISPILMVMFTIICILWIYAIRKIYFEYQKIV